MESISRSEGQAEREQMIIDEFDFVRDVCSRLPPRWGLEWTGTAWQYKKEEEIAIEANEIGLLGQFEEALKQRRRGKRLVVIVAWGGVLYQFV